MVALIHRVEFPGGVPFRDSCCRFVPDHSHPQLTSAGRKLITGNLDVNNFAEIISSRDGRSPPSAYLRGQCRNSTNDARRVSRLRKSALKKPRASFENHSGPIMAAPRGCREGVPQAAAEPEKKFLRHCGERCFSVPETAKCANSGRTRRIFDGWPTGSPTVSPAGKSAGRTRRPARMEPCGGRRLSGLRPPAAGRSRRGKAALSPGRVRWPRRRRSSLRRRRLR